ncbi:MAG TPA: hypothetical protein IAC91_07245 [Candidatus Faecimorpha stercoravium]|nr:hypothetical protein [Candidatus Faecimorpha stercoravium]
MMMRRIPVWIQLKDTQYQQRLTAYLRQFQNEKIEIREKWDEGVRRVTDKKEEGQDNVWLCFQGEEKEDPMGVCAYQKGGILTQIICGETKGECTPGYQMEGFEESTLEEQAPVYPKREPLAGLYGIYSPIGGCGKTTFALAYCEILAKKKPSHKVLYWSAEGAADWRLYFQNHCPYNLSDLIYCMLMEGSEGMGEYLREIAVGQENGVYFIRPCHSFQDLNTLQESELYQLLCILTDYFDEVICDMNTAFESVNRWILKYCGHRFYILNESPSGALKMQEFVEALRKQGEEQEYLQERSRFFFIGGKGNDNREKTDVQGYRIQAMLPWCNRLYRENEGRLQMRQDNSYYERIRQLVQ